MSAPPTERLVFDPAGSGDEHLSGEERDRRERRRETLTGVTDYAVDRAVAIAAFAMDGGLHVADLVGGGARRVDIGADDPFDPRPDPSGQRIAYVAGGALRVVDVGGVNDRELASDPDPDVSWGLAEFVAAEEMERLRGYWWSPDGSATRGRSRGRTSRRHLAHRRAGRSRGAVARGPLSGRRHRQRYRHARDRRSRWRARRRRVGSRCIPLPRQRRMERQRPAHRARGVAGPAHDADPAGRSRHGRRPISSARTTTNGGSTSPSGSPHGSPTAVWCARWTSTTRKRLTFDDEPVTPVGLQVAQVLDVGDGVVFRANEDPTEAHVWRVDADGIADPALR